MRLAALDASGLCGLRAIELLHDIPIGGDRRDVYPCLWFRRNITDTNALRQIFAHNLDKALQVIQCRLPDLVSVGVSLLYRSLNDRNA